MGQKFNNLSPEEYGHKLDLEILSPLNQIKGSDDVKDYFVKLWPKVRQQTIALCGSNFHVTPGACTQLYNLGKSVADMVCQENLIPMFYVEEGYHINSYTLKDQDAYYLVLTTGAVDRLTADELKFLIGHELGHLVAGHVEYHLFLAFLPESVKFGLRMSELGHNIIEKGLKYIPWKWNKKEEDSKDDEKDLAQASGYKRIISVAGGLTRLNKWNRISEYTADRIGLLACQDINVALSALMKISGLPQSYYKDASVEEFVKQANEFKQTYGGNYDSLLKDLDVLDEDHPWLIRRASELLDWYNSVEYKKLLDSADINNQ